MNENELNTLFHCPLCKSELEFNPSNIICMNCKTVFAYSENINILLPTEVSKNLYSMNYFEHYDLDSKLFDYYEERECQATAHDERRVREYILSLVSRKTKTVLDVGSGNSWVAELLCKKDKDVISMDLSVVNIKKGLAKFPYKNHFAVAADALNSPFKNDSIDCVISSEVIEHIVDPQQFIDSLIKIVKPGGLLIISTPYKEKIQMSLCIHCNQLTPRNAHLHSFNENKLKDFADSDVAESCKTYVFGNKLLIMLRTYILLKYLPFSIWKIIDSISSIFINKKAHIIAVYKKREKVE